MLTAGGGMACRMCGKDDCPHLNGQRSYEEETAQTAGSKESQADRIRKLADEINQKIREFPTSDQKAKEAMAADLIIGYRIAARCIGTEGSDQILSEIFVRSYSQRSLPAPTPDLIAAFISEIKRLSLKNFYQPFS